MIKRFFQGFVIGSSVALLLYVVLFSINAIVVEQQCLAAGYSKYKVSYNFEKYCVDVLEDKVLKLLPE